MRLLSRTRKSQRWSKCHLYVFPFNINGALFFVKKQRLAMPRRRL